MSDKGSPPNWTELNPDILDVIIHKLDIIDFLRFSATCQSWNSSAKTHTVNCPKTLNPWLLTTKTFDLEKLAKEQEKIESEFSVWSTTSQNTYKIPLFPPLDNYFAAVASSDGFLFIINSNYNLYVINPFTKAHFPLPTMTGIITKYGFYFSQIDKVVIKTCCGTRIPLLTVVIIASTVFCAKVGGRSWMKLRCGQSLPNNVKFDECVFDIIFHKEKLHAVCASGLYVFDLLFDISVTPTKLVEAFEVSGRSYLVESPNGDDLFLVVRMANYEGIENKEEWVTTGFMMFKYDENRGLWVEVKEIGEFMLFVGHNSLFSARNCVFTNKICFVDELGSGGIGVLDFCSGRIEHIDLPIDLRRTEKWNAFWFIPSLT